MNIYQGASLAATFAVATAAASGLALSFNNFDGSVVEYATTYTHGLILVAASVGLKLKTGFGDHQHFGEEGTSAYRTRYIGFILGALSWIFWSASAPIITQPSKAAELLLCALALSTLWIFVHFLEMACGPKSRPEATPPPPEEVEAKQKSIAHRLWVKMSRYLWVAFNIGYMVLLLMYTGYIGGWSDVGSVYYLLIFVGIVFLDALVDDSYKRCMS